MTPMHPGERVWTSAGKSGAKKMFTIRTEIIKTQLLFELSSRRPLTGPAAILSCRAILVAIVSGNSFVWGGGGIAQLPRDMLQNGVLHRCACVKRPKDRKKQSRLNFSIPLEIFNLD